MPMKGKRRREQSHQVLRVTIYQRLEEYLGAFARGHFHLLILVGSGGLAKSSSRCVEPIDPAGHGLPGDCLRTRSGDPSGQELEAE